MFFSQLTSFVVFWTVWVFYIKYANKDYLYKEERERERKKQTNTLIQNEKKKTKTKQTTNREHVDDLPFRTVSIMVDWLESEPCPNIFQFLGHFARCSIQPFGDHFAFVQIQIIVLLAKVAVENILRGNKQ